MARTQKDTVNYFPHDAQACSGDTLMVLQSQFGNDGYAFWFKLLEKLAATDGHYLDCSNGTKWQLLLAKTGVNDITGVDIMKLLVEMKAVDGDLWDERIIWCQKLVDNVTDVYRNRRRVIPRKPVTTKDNQITTGDNCIICGKTIVDMRTDAKYCSSTCKQKAFRVTDNSFIRNAKNHQNSITTDDNTITTEKTNITTPQSTQSKVKESKVNKRIDKKSNNLILPDFIDKGLWGDFLDMRVQKKSKPTDRAKELLVKKLTEIHVAGHDPNEILERSIMNGWSGIFAPDGKGDTRGTYKGNPGQKPAGAFSDIE